MPFKKGGYDKDAEHHQDYIYCGLDRRSRRINAYGQLAARSSQHNVRGRHLADVTMTRRYLSVTEVAHRLGITAGGLLNLKLPKPDALTGRTRGWLPSTIDEWNANRPGHGGRPKENQNQEKTK